MSSALALSTANFSMSAPTDMIASCCGFGSLSNTSLDIISGSDTKQHNLSRTPQRAGVLDILAPPAPPPPPLLPLRVVGLDRRFGGAGAPARLPYPGHD